MATRDQRRLRAPRCGAVALGSICVALGLALGGCALPGAPAGVGAEASGTPVAAAEPEPVPEVRDRPAQEPEARVEPVEEPEGADASGAGEPQDAAGGPQAGVFDTSALALTQDFRPSFVHGEKPASCQRYIVLHDTEGDSSASSVVDWWDSNGAGVAAHFVVDQDGSVVQCVPLDKIAHHAGFGDSGHNALYGVEDESRDDRVGTQPIGSWASDYGMNSYSVGIELVHVGGSGAYPEAQLDALDALIAAIDGYYGFPSQIIDHKAWRTGNSDTSPEFAEHLAAYQADRCH